MLNDIDFVFKFLLQFKPAMYRRVHILTKNCHFSQEGAVPACQRYRPGPVKGLKLKAILRCFIQNIHVLKVRHLALEISITLSDRSFSAFTFARNGFFLKKTCLFIYLLNARTLSSLTRQLGFAIFLGKCFG